MELRTATEQAKNELKRAGLMDAGSDYDGMIGEAVSELLDVFAKQGHSGASAALTVNLFRRVALGEALTPLTGDPAEWIDHETGPGTGNYQSCRASCVFSDDLKRAYTIDGVVFVEDNGAGFTSILSRVWFDLPGNPPATRRVHKGDWLASPELQAEFPGVFGDD